MRVRIVASVVTAALILLGTTGCNYFTPQSTLKHYDASDGVSATIGVLDVRNALLLTKDGVSASLLVTLLNTGTSTLNVGLQYQTVSSGSPAPQRTTRTVTIPANGSAEIGYSTANQIVFDNVGAKAGSLLPLYIQYGTEPGRQILVPVLDGTLKAYSTLLPSPAPSISGSLPASASPSASAPAGSPSGTASPSPSVSASP
ncbi:MAG: hypothetical protein ACYCZK_03670 [Microbacteriaceae bacterium]